MTAPDLPDMPDLPEGLAFPLLVGTTDMPCGEFYRALAPDVPPAAYALPRLWERTVEKYPPICPDLVLAGEPGARTYVVRNVAVAAPTALVGEGTGSSAPARARWSGVRDVREVRSPGELAELACYKVKPLRADGTFGPRVLLHPDNARACASMAGRLSVTREFGRFIYYSYACFVEPGPAEGVTTFEQFRRLYGGAVFAVELERPGAALGLMWPDWICHEPDNHLELGVLYRGAGERYAAFSGFSKGDPLVIRILARGFEDLELRTTLGEEPPYEWSHDWFEKMLKKKGI